MPLLMPARAAYRAPGGHVSIAGLLGMLRTWQRRASSRAQLAAMDERGLTDLALSRSEAQREAAKPFWQA